MKKTILSLAFALCALFAFGQYTYTENWPDGKKKLEGQYQSAVEILSTDTKEQKAQKMSTAIRIGKWQHWHQNGQLASVEYYNNGVMTGHWQSWYENGSVESDIDFSTGKAVYYYSDGKKHSEGKMKAGMIQDGFWVAYHSNGNKNTEGSYTNGQKNGEWKFYDEKGNHYFTEKWNNGVKAN
ncbi:MAG: hypothetical protein IT233_09380 [Bacteroidia bacterium]|nr:hypothetical protein [Bacteroidia bacterium]